MKKKKPKGNPRRQPKKKSQSPWHKYRAVAPRVARNDEIIIPPVSDADELAAEIEQLEMDRDAEPPEEDE
jgi:hypothetical protein